MKIEMNTSESQDNMRDLTSLVNDTIGGHSIPLTKKQLGLISSPITVSKFGFEVEHKSYRRNFSKFNDSNVSTAIERFESYERHKKKLQEIERSGSPRKPQMLLSKVKSNAKGDTRISQELSVG